MVSTRYGLDAVVMNSQQLWSFVQDQVSLHSGSCPIPSQRAIVSPRLLGEGTSVFFKGVATGRFVAHALVDSSNPWVALIGFSGRFILRGG